MRASGGVLLVLAGVAGAVASCSLFVTFNDSLIPEDDSGLPDDVGSDAPVVDATDGGADTPAPGDAGDARPDVAEAAGDALVDTAVADTAVADTAVADTAIVDTAVADTAVDDTLGVDAADAD